MARKELPKDKLKIKQINFCLTDNEYQIVRQQAEACGMHLNNWLRKYLFSKQFPPVKMSPQIADAITALNKVGNNLNQIARVANASKEIPPNFDNTMNDVQNQIHNLKNKISDDSKTN